MTYVNEIHPAVDATRVQARREAKVAAIENRKKANQALQVRAVAAAIAVAVLCLLGGVGLMSWVLALPLILTTGFWIAIWFGAWLQYRYAYGGGLLNGIK